MIHLSKHSFENRFREKQTGIDPFRFLNVVRSMKNEYVGNSSNLHALRKLASLPINLLVNADAFTSPIVAPVFIIGAPRSGTTFLGNCFRDISGFCYFHEPASTKCAAAHAYLHPKRWSSLGRFYQFQYRMLIASRADRAGSRQTFVEKTPRNCFVVDFLNATFPDAKFIHIIRDGVDSAYSNAQKHWLDSELDGKQTHEHAGYLLGSTAQFWTEADRTREFESASKLRRCAWVWRRYTESAIEKLKVVPEKQQLEIRYETMANEPELISQRVSNFLSLNVNQASAMKSHIVKVKTSSIGNAKRHLSAAEYSEIVHECGTLRCKLDYN